MNLYELATDLSCPVLKNENYWWGDDQISSDAEFMILNGERVDKTVIDGYDVQSMQDDNEARMYMLFAYWACKED